MYLNGKTTDPNSQIKRILNRTWLTLFWIHGVTWDMLYFLVYIINFQKETTMEVKQLNSIYY